MTRGVEYTAYKKKQKDLILFSMEERGLRGESLCTIWQQNWEKLQWRWIKIFLRGAQEVRSCNQGSSGKRKVQSEVVNHRETLHSETVVYLGDFQKPTEGLKQSNLALKVALLFAEVRQKLFKTPSQLKIFWFHKRKNSCLQMYYTSTDLWLKHILQLLHFSKLFKERGVRTHALYIGLLFQTQTSI